jgi:hypothetical protein
VSSCLQLPLRRLDLIPPCSDAVGWQRRTRSLLWFLRRPRKWVDVYRWARKHDVDEWLLINELAWLDLAGFVVSEGGTWSRVRTENG